MGIIRLSDYLVAGHCKPELEACCAGKPANVNGGFFDRSLIKNQWAHF